MAQKGGKCRMAECQLKKKMGQGRVNKQEYVTSGSFENLQWGEVGVKTIPPHLTIPHGHQFVKLSQQVAQITRVQCKSS